MIKKELILTDKKSKGVSLNDNIIIEAKDLNTIN